jgi:hypothetical protein
MLLEETAMAFAPDSEAGVDVGRKRKWVSLVWH